MRNSLIRSGYGTIGTKILFAITLLLLWGMSAYSQCAGQNNSVTICNKFDDISNRNFDLFANLNGMPSPGGSWSTPNPANLSALDINTGIVDLWMVNRFGEHQFIYTNGNCGESATVTLFLGGYAGEDNVDGSANACSDDSAVNMFSFLGSLVDEVVPDFNGLWEEDPMTLTGFLSGNLFNAEAAGPGEYIFTYTVPAVDACPGAQSTIFLEVHAAPNSGIPSNLVVCTTDDLSGYTNFNLNSLLIGEDPNGTWSEGITNQIDNLTDNIINVEEINAIHGFGVYSFIYTVSPTHPVCPESYSEVFIVILPTLNGSLDATNYCVGTDYEVTLDYDNSILPPGQYELAYRTNSSEGLQDGVAVVALNNGTASFIVSPSLVPINETVQLDIIGIQGTLPEQDVCPNISVQQTTFLVSDPKASGQNICPNNEVEIQLENILDLLGNLSDNVHNIDYTLSLPDNSNLDLSAENVQFLDGSGTFSIPSTHFELPGAYTVDIEVTNSLEMNCLITTAIQVTPIPEEIELDIAVDNNCDATSIDVLVNAPNLPNGSYTIEYEVMEQNTQTSLTDNTINFMGGVAVYGIDIANLPDGDYIVLLKSSQNDSTPCRLQFEFELEESFSIGGIPTVINVESNQSFCLNDGVPTLADITVDTSGNITFYDTLEDNMPLPLNTILVDGEDYFVFSENENDNCSPNERARVTVSLVQASTPISENVTPIYCGIENPMLMDLEVTSTNNGTILWYDTTSGGTPLDPEEVLVDGQSYFASELLDGFCEGGTRLEIVPTVINPPLPDLQSGELLLCGLDNPTVAQLFDLENPIDAIVEWYDVPEGGEPLSSFDPLMDDAIYYAQSYDEDSGCVNLNRVPVAVDLNNCDPEKYGFFIPDAFSPNNDGRNDTYYIPNMEIIFPDFILEIYNRYGNLMFKGDASNKAWNGSGTGNQIAPNGVYFYIIYFNKDNYAPKQGRLYLNR